MDIQESLLVLIKGKQIKSFKEFNIYPNPFNSTFKIEIDSESLDYNQVILRLINIRGEVVFSSSEQYFKNNIYTFSIDKINLPSGLYLGNIKTNKKTITSK